jgi:hypothetical protein
VGLTEPDAILRVRTTRNVALLFLGFLAACETILYRSEVQLDERPLVVVGRAVRVESLPLPPVPPEECHKDGCWIPIRMEFPQLVQFAVREVVFGDLRKREVTFLYWSHLGFGNRSSEYLLALRPVDGNRWDWELPRDGRMFLLDTKEGEKAVPFEGREVWLHLPCTVVSHAVPLEFVANEQYGEAATDGNSATRHPQDPAGARSDRGRHDLSRLISSIGLRRSGTPPSSCSLARA